MEFLDDRANFTFVLSLMEFLILRIKKSCKARYANGKEARKMKNLEDQNSVILIFSLLYALQSMDQFLKC